MFLLRLFRTFMVGMQMAFIEMGHHKLRSFLSMLGVMLGVAALVAMLSLIGGINVFLQEKMGRWIGSMWISRAWHPSDQDKLAWSRSPGLHLGDGDYLEADTSHVKVVYQSIERRGNVIVRGQRLWGMRIRGCAKETMDEDTKLTLPARGGRSLRPEDYIAGAKVCVIAWDAYDMIAKSLLRAGQDTAGIVNSDLIFRNVRLRIVGVLMPVDTMSKPWQISRSVIMPMLAMQRYFTGFDPDPGSISLIVNDPKQLQAQSQAVARTLATQHRGVTDFQYRGADWVENMSMMLGNISLVMGVISAVSLLVGGLGIMNVMLSSISERIKEIGIRKALGAEDLQIFIQFLAETSTLSMTGGILGAALGLLPVMFGEAIRKSTQGSIFPTVLPQHALLVFVVIVSVGIVFGLYPAIKASRMNPIEALRYE